MFGVLATRWSVVIACTCMRKSHTTHRSGGCNLSSIDLLVAVVVVVVRPSCWQSMHAHTPTQFIDSQTESEAHAQCVVSSGSGCGQVDNREGGTRYIRMATTPDQMHHLVCRRLQQLDAVG
jgi:hypothetical protein